MKNNEKNKQQSFLSNKSNTHNKTKDSLNQDKTFDISKSRNEGLLETAIENYDETLEVENDEQELIKLEENEKLDSENQPDLELSELEATCFRYPHLIFCSCVVPCQEKKPTYPIEVCQDVYVGGLFEACCIQNLKEIGITHILNVSTCEYYLRKQHFTYLKVDAIESIEEDIKKHFRRTNRFINEALKKNGKVLIHSEKGNSRAPSFAIAYMIKFERMSFKMGLERMDSLINININEYFLKQLQQYENELIRLKKIL